VEREHVAKTTASVLFFVFDRRTRNVASMVEVAYIAASKRKIMLVLDTYPGPGHLIGEEALSKDEYEELSGGLNTVQDLVERRGIPVFSQIPHALHCTAKIINEDLWPQQLGIADNVTPVRNTCLTPTQNYNKIQAAFGGCSLTLAESQNIFSDIVGRPMTHDELLTVVSAKKGLNPGSSSIPSELPLQEVMITAEEFCCIVTEFSNPRLEKRKLRDVFTNTIMSTLQKTLGVSKDLPRRSPRLGVTKASGSPTSSPTHQTSQRYLSQLSNSTDSAKQQQHQYSVYLGGAVDSTQSWQSKIAVPLLKQNNISYCLPMQNGSTNGLTNLHLSNGGDYNDQTRGRLYPTEAQNIEQCRVLLFVITNNTRGKIIDKKTKIN